MNEFYGVPQCLCLTVRAPQVGLTSAGSLVQQLVPGRALALEAYGPVHTDVRAASVVKLAFIQACGESEHRSGRLTLPPKKTHQPQLTQQSL